jgi:DMSO/TMAO reductase YedYZ heme-binding membrane subunit
MRDNARYAPIGASALSSALVAMWAFGVVVGHDEQVRFAVRETAYVSATFFLFAYVARPLHLLAASAVSAYIVRARRQFGLAAALAHTVHFGFVVALFETVATATTSIVTVVFGGFGFVVYWAMAATSNDASVRALGPNWKRLHRFGIHYLWFIYFVTFLGAAAHRPFDWVFIAVFVNALAMRIYLWTRRRATLSAPAA